MSKQEQGRKSDGVFALVAAFLVLLVCSRSSFLYPFNIWDDVNSYFTVGKSILFGKVPYRDLFDQKGFLHYLIYTCGYLFSNKTLHGAFIMEALAAGASALGITRILQLFLSRSMSLFLMPFTLAFLYTARNFWWGGSAEEMLLPVLIWGIYLVLHHLLEIFPEPMSYQQVLIGGILAGCVLHIKFNSLGFYFAFMLVVFISDCMGGLSGLKKGLISCLVFESGIALVTLPIFLYFAVNGAVYDWLHVYFYQNIFTYSEKMPFAVRMKEMVLTIYRQAMVNKRIFIPVLIGMVGGLTWMIRSLVRAGQFAGKGERACEKRRAVLCYFGLLSMVGFLALGIFIGGVDLPYYAFPMAAFTVFGMLVIGKILERLLKKVSALIDAAGEVGGIPGRKGRQFAGRPGSEGFDYLDDLRSAETLQPVEERAAGGSAGLVWILAVCLSVLIAFASSRNVPFMQVPREDLYVYRFLNVIEESGVKDPKLLNMNCFDQGLYTVTGAVPDCYYFQTQTIHLPDIDQVQRDYVKSQKADFVLSRDTILDFDTTGYEILDQADIDFQGYTHHYFLYARTAALEAAKAGH